MVGCKTGQKKYKLSLTRQPSFDPAASYSHFCSSFLPLPGSPDQLWTSLRGFTFRERHVREPMFLYFGGLAPHEASRVCRSSPDPHLRQRFDSAIKRPQIEANMQVASMIEHNNSSKEVSREMRCDSVLMLSKIPV